MKPYIDGMLGRCPNCGRGQMRDGWFKLHERCAECGLVFQDKPGDFTGATVLSYGLISIITLSFGLLAVWLTDWPLGVIFLIGTALTLIIGVTTYQPLKGLWVAFQVENGWLERPHNDL